MSRPIAEICSLIDTFRPIDGQWPLLDGLIAEALDHCDAREAFRSLLGVFAQFPHDDGASIIHGLESFPDFQPTLLNAVRESPTELSITMVRRLLNANETHVGDVSWLSVLQSVAENDANSHAVRAAASRIVDLHSR